MLHGVPGSHLTCGLIVIAFVLASGPSALGHDVEPEGGPSDLPPSAAAPCDDGLAHGYPCLNVDLLARVSPVEAGGARANDLWGWTDPETGTEWALLGLINGTAFVDLSAPTRPVVAGFLPTHSRSSTWRDIKVYRDHAFISAEARRHGLQVFDLRRLRSVSEGPETFEADAHYNVNLSAHNVVINEETGFLYLVGTNSCAGGLHMLDVREPQRPEFIGCYAGDGYTHDAQCVVYRGPDAAFQGREICFASNEDTLSIVDVTDKEAPSLIARERYLGSEYTHQGWLTEDHRYFLLDDELDEKNRGTKTRTFVWDVSELAAPWVTGFHESGSDAIDHNQYVRGAHVFQANYRSGVRILRLGALDEAELAEVAFFDTVPENDNPSFTGAWSVYPFFESGLLVASDVYGGLFVLRPDLAAIGECGDGIDNDGDGDRDFPQDTACVSDEDEREALRTDLHVHVAPFSDAHQVELSRRLRWVDVEIHGSAVADARDIVIGDLRLDGVAPLSPSARERRRRYWDSDADGYDDLFVRFPTRPLALGPGLREFCMTGTIGLDPLYGCDTLEIVDASPPSSGPGRGRPAATLWRLLRWLLRVLAFLG